MDDIEQAVSRIGQLGRSIGEELDGQVRGRDCAGWGIVRRKRRMEMDVSNAWDVP